MSFIPQLHAVEMDYVIERSKFWWNSLDVYERAKWLKYNSLPIQTQKFDYLFKPLKDHIIMNYLENAKRNYE